VRTTLDIDDDVLRLVRELAQRECCSSGAVISPLARAGLRAPPSLSAGARSLFGLRPTASRARLSATRPLSDCAMKPASDAPLMQYVCLEHSRANIDQQCQYDGIEQISKDAMECPDAAHGLVDETDIGSLP
jgi:hypothetical protein